MILRKRFVRSHRTIFGLCLPCSSGREYRHCLPLKGEPISVTLTEGVVSYYPCLHLTFFNRQLLQAVEDLDGRSFWTWMVAMIRGDENDVRREIYAAHHREAAENQKRVTNLG